MRYLKWSKVSFLKHSTPIQFPPPSLSSFQLRKLRPAWINLPQFSTYHFYTNIHSSYVYFFSPLAFEIQVISIQDQFHSHLCTYPHLTCKSLTLLIIHFSRLLFFNPHLISEGIFSFFKEGIFPIDFGASRRVGRGGERENHRDKRETHWLFAPYWCPDGNQDRDFWSSGPLRKTS